MTAEPARPFIIPVKRFIGTIILAGFPACLTAQKVPASDGSPENIADVNGIRANAAAPGPVRTSLILGTKKRRTSANSGRPHP